MIRLEDYYRERGFTSIELLAVDLPTVVKDAKERGHNYIEELLSEVLSDPVLIEEHWQKNLGVNKTYAAIVIYLILRSNPEIYKNWENHEPMELCGGLIIRGSYWRLKDQPHYIFKVIGTAIEGADVKGCIVMYEQLGLDYEPQDYSWTMESTFRDRFEPDPYNGSPRDEPVQDWFTPYI